MRPVRTKCDGEQWEFISDQILSYAQKISDEHNGFHSSHEAWGVIDEEIREFKDSLQQNDLEASVEEAKQVAACCLVYCALFSPKLPKNKFKKNDIVRMDAVSVGDDVTCDTVYYPNFYRVQKEPE